MKKRNRDRQYELAVTPGEELQNFFAYLGICKPVQFRSLHEPEPPAGLWNTLNVGVLVVSFTTLAGGAWLLLGHIIPYMGQLN